LGPDAVGFLSGTIGRAARAAKAYTCAWNGLADDGALRESRMSLQDEAADLLPGAALSRAAQLARRLVLLYSIFAGVIVLQEIPFNSHFTPAMEVGWWLAYDYWGKGYATEGARAALEDAGAQLIALV